jgi:chromosome segregation ATPase
MFTKGQADFLTDAGDAAKKRLFKSLLNLDKIDKMYEKIKESYSALSNEAIQLETQIKIKQSQIETANKAYGEYLEQKAKYEIRREDNIQVLKKKLEQEGPEIDSSLKYKLEATGETLNKITEQLYFMEKGLPSLQEELKEIYGIRGHYGKEMHRLEEGIESSQGLGGATCDYCGSALTKKGLWQHIQNKEKEYSELQTIYCHSKDD